MKKIRSGGFIVLILAVFTISTLNAHAALENRGTDINGNRLIYDTDLDITWYDYSNAVNTWYTQVAWVDSLSVTFDGNVYNDWRLPTSINQGGSGPCEGYNCTGSEMGHLFYTEFNSSAEHVPNITPFQNLKGDDLYWSGTEYEPNPAAVWYFFMLNGYQNHYSSKNDLNYALAVRNGDVTTTVVPEPISSILFITGGALFIGRKYLKKA